MIKILKLTTMLIAFIFSGLTFATESETIIAEFENHAEALYNQRLERSIEVTTKEAKEKLRKGLSDILTSDQKVQDYVKNYRPNIDLMTDKFDFIYARENTCGMNDQDEYDEANDFYVKCIKGFMIFLKLDGMIIRYNTLISVIQKNNSMVLSRAETPLTSIVADSPNRYIDIIFK